MRTLTRCLAATLGALCAVAASAGPLTPPPGPVAPTMKTLDQVEARRPIETVAGNSAMFRIITEPGSYYLTRDLVITGSANIGIYIHSSDVTIDLNGFTLRGPGSEAIAVTSGSTNVVIRNGFINGWSSYGVHAHKSVVIEDVTVTNSGQSGFSVGADSVLRRCVSRGNGNAGFRFTGPRVSAIECRALANSAAGFDIEAGGELRDCTSSFNSGAGVVANSSAAVRISGCMITDNNGGGVAHARETVIERSTISKNASFGVQIAFQSHVRECEISNNSGFGVTSPVSVGGNIRSTIEGNTISGNAGNSVHFPVTVSGVAVVRNILRANGGPVLVGPGVDVPMSNLSGPAGPWSNLQY